MCSFVFWKSCVQTSVFRPADISESFRKFFGLPEKAEVKGYWSSLRHVELHDLYSWYNIMRVIKSRGMR